MRHELIIKDERGTTGIEVKFWSDATFGTDRYGNEFRYDILVWNIPPKKRSKHYELTSFATNHEIYCAKMELWEKIKP